MNKIVLVAKFNKWFCAPEVIEKLKESFDLEIENQMIYVYRKEDERIHNTDEAHEIALLENDMFNSRWL